MTRVTLFSFTAAALAVGGLAAVLAQSAPPALESQTVASAASLAAYGVVARVAMSPRCQNCHTLSNFPRQGDDGHPHLFHVTRGTADHGAPGFSCATCHMHANNSSSGVPGAREDWRLAPLGMGWEGLSAPALCRQLKEPHHNGNRSGEQIIDHLKSPLVMWSWSPGTDRTGRLRTAPPVAYEDFLRAAELWVRTGAACPAT
jgi:hypothetical protein